MKMRNLKKEQYFCKYSPGFLNRTILQLYSFLNGREFKFGTIMAPKIWPVVFIENRIKTVSFIIIVMLWTFLLTWNCTVVGFRKGVYEYINTLF